MPLFSQVKKAQCIRSIITMSLANLCCKLNVFEEVDMI